jgi:two-component system NtrC family response regulator
VTKFENSHVLIIDDDDTSVDVLAHLLSQLEVGYTVIFDSCSVSETLRDVPFLSAIFVDLEMPGCDGYELIEQLQAIPELDAIPFVAYTSHVSEMANCRDAGFHSFLGKPLHSVRFREQIQRIFANQPVWEAR